MEEYTWFDGELSITLTQAQINACTHDGIIYDDCYYVSEEIKEQLKKYPHEKIVDFLVDTGGWFVDELTDEEETNIKFIWMICNDIQLNPDSYL